ncbi:hypothetical protein NQ318_000847 [Aromia moschata]|uniref:Uncharacterized protein n=1 Tax=Aromia moschata TaxID=1265417 RepID=A0AAV8XC47_9CUCU|nr:hypothetical protein NQ318_000847 [Aromia moschata]
MAIYTSAMNETSNLGPVDLHVFGVADHESGIRITPAHLIQGQMKTCWDTGFVIYDPKNLGVNWAERSYISISFCGSVLLSFIRLGCEHFTHPPVTPTPDEGATRSLFFPRRRHIPRPPEI